MEKAEGVFQNHIKKVIIEGRSKPEIEMDLQFDRKEMFFIGIVLLMILAWTLGNLSVAYFGMEDQAVNREPDNPDYEGGSSTPFAIDIPDFIRDILFVGVIAGFVGWLLFSNEGWKRKSLRGAAFLAVISVIYFSDYIFPKLLSILSLFGAFLPDVEYSSIPEVIFGEGSQQIFSSIGSSIAILVFLASILIALFLFLRYKKFSEEDSVAKEDISSTADRALTELHEGDDVRDVVIRNYQKMLIILEEEGVHQDISFTPRELEKMVLAKLTLTEETIDEMTELFEEAKYSDHPLGEKERNRAMDNFKQIREELEGVEDA